MNLTSEELQEIWPDPYIDHLLSITVPGGSHARDWFIPHQLPMAENNVRDVVRRMLWQAHQLAQQSHVLTSDARIVGSLH